MLSHPETRSCCPCRNHEGNHWEVEDYDGPDFGLQSQPVSYCPPSPLSHSTPHRFDIADRKGLEIALLTTLLTIHDMTLANHAPADPVVLAPPAQPEAPPSPPPRPAPKTGINRIAEMHALRYEPNEVTINEEGTIEDYGEYAEALLAVRSVCLAHVRCRSHALRNAGRCDALHHGPLSLAC